MPDTLIDGCADDVMINSAEKTHQEYEGAARLYIVPFIGDVKLTRLNGEQLVAWQGKLARKKFSNNMRLRSIRVFRNALNKAVKMRLIPLKPIAVLDKPKGDPKGSHSAGTRGLSFSVFGVSESPTG